ncbi:hypothetical protein [Salmonella phage SD-1_S14]|nr:hypothetical protein [Salmonella phage SD-1_S14]
MSVKDISKYEEFLKSFLNSKLTIFNEYGESFIINDDVIVFESFEEIKRTNNTLRDIINSINAQYITFQLSADEEDEFQKRTVYENVFPHELNSVIIKVLNKVFF